MSYVFTHSLTQVGVNGFIVVDLLTDSNSTFIQTITAKVFIVFQLLEKLYVLG
jgi:hypothetical protein